MATAPTPTGADFSLAMDLVRRLRPPGHRYVLDNEPKLAEDYAFALTEGAQSAYYRQALLKTPALFANLVRIAWLSKRARQFTRPCCSTRPLIWPFCRRNC